MERRWNAVQYGLCLPWNAVERRFLGLERRWNAVQLGRTPLLERRGTPCHRICSAYVLLGRVQLIESDVGHAGVYLVRIDQSTVGTIQCFLHNQPVFEKKAGSS